jgi:hypothetical protein
VAARAMEPARLLGFGLFINGRLLRGLKLLHGFLQAGYGSFECRDLGVGSERILRHEPLKKVNVALKAPRSFVQPGGFRAVLYSRDILCLSGINCGAHGCRAPERTI